MKTLRTMAVLLLLTSLVSAEGTSTWSQSRYDEFSRGTAKGVALRSDGTLELAPAFTQIFASPSTFVWAAVSDADGNVYLGTGAPARIYKITPDGNATVIFEPKELQVQSLAIRGGVVYAATSPDGKVYRIERTGNVTMKPADPKKDSEAAQSAQDVPTDSNYTATVYYEPGTKYIWAMTFDAAGNLYVATGDKGEIFRVTRSGEGAVFFKSDETHVRTLAFDSKGNLYAGSDGSGLVYRISVNGEGFVLYSAPKKEITALAVDDVGNVFAAGVGEKRTGATSMPQPMQQFPQPAMTSAVGIQPAQPIMMVPFSATGGSDIYVISADGAPRRLWTSKDDIVYALAFDAGGRLIAGMGNKGRVVSIARNGDFTDLVKASAAQVTAFAPAPNRGLYAATSNLGKVFRIAAIPENEGSFESDVFDARVFSRWGRVELRSAGNVELFARSGNVDNPDRNWGPWKKVDLAKQSVVDAPASRFLQWKVVLRPEVKSASVPSVDSLRIFYRSKNVAPVVDEVVVQTGARVNPANVPRPPLETVSINLTSGQPQPQPQRFEAPVAAQKDRGSVTVRWAAHDDNEDDLLYALYYRGDDETRWKLLRDKLAERLYSFDAGLLPDGGYVIKIIASDAPSHTLEDALSNSRESARFEVDTTAPRVDGLAARIEGGKLRIRFTASDSFSSIQRAEYSIDAGEWQFVEPVGQISDHPAEDYDFTAPLPPAPPTGGDAELSTEHTIVVRVLDRFDNVGTAKVVVK
ncbi:MAG: hypothetical protein HYX26_03035 [Acidobacteriales bacterium]|nr:hypothetical protein [Terriglobales bacterium]